jgi:enediyne biosynthesis protein E4
MWERAAACLVTLLLLQAGCGHGAAPGHTPAPDWFVDEAAAAGLDFVHFNGMSGELFIAEILAPGVALLDYDNDGDLDVFVVQGQMLGSNTTLEDARLPPPPGPHIGRLYRNDLEVHADGTRTLRFTDVTEASGIRTVGYGMGVAVGDFTNNGCVDLYVTNFGPNQLFRNNCDGTFTDVSRTSGTDDPSWSVSAAFVDYDRDGWLDLYVGNYLRYSVDASTHCISAAGVRDYCTPDGYPPQPDRLYRNLGDGTFLDVTARSRVGSEYGPALGVSTADFNGDGWIDIYVANDGRENQLWINQQDGTFRNTALLAGVALNADGRAEGSMGVDAGDIDNDGDEDLVMTHLAGEGHTLYLNDGTGMFEDRSVRTGVGPMSLPYTGFGMAWFDFDNDGWLDLLTVNGTVQIIQRLAQAGDPLPLRQRMQLFRNVGDGRFEDVTDRAGTVFTIADVGRGAAFGDVDNDGDVDVVVANNNGPLRLLINQIGNRRPWLGLRLLGGDAAPRDMLGARVEIVRPGSTSLVRRARSDGSYASANDPRILVGLGDSAPPDVQVTWPGGRTERWSSVPVNQYTTLREGEGR